MSEAGSGLRFCRCLGAKSGFWRQVEETKTGKDRNAGWDLTELTRHGLIREKKKQTEIKGGRIFCLLVLPGSVLGSGQCLSGAGSACTASTTAGEHGIQKPRGFLGFWGRLGCCPFFSKCTSKANNTCCILWGFPLLFTEDKWQPLQGCCLNTRRVSIPAGQTLGPLGDFD